MKIEIPQTVKVISSAIKDVAACQKQLLAGLKGLHEVIKNRDVLIQQMSEAGTPDSMEPFNAALLSVEEQANALVQIATYIADAAHLQLGKDPKDWW